MKKQIKSFHFYLMFRFFNIPRVNYNYYRPTIYRRKYVPVESYLLNSIRQEQEIENLRSVLYNSIIRQQYKDLISKAELPQEEVESEKHIQDQNNETSETNQKQSIPLPVYYFESHSRFDGEKIIEERKERKIDSKGKVHQTLKRRLGDQWYETEKVEDENGGIENKETWHNVSEEEIENFKKEWTSKSFKKLQLNTNCEYKEDKQEENMNSDINNQIKDEQITNNELIQTESNKENILNQEEEKNLQEHHILSEDDIKQD